jgi:predicted DNA-binding transcriptional regulator AlpA
VKNNNQTAAVNPRPPFQLQPWRGVERLMSKREVLALIGVSFPTVWKWMRAGKFPRSRVVVGKVMWLSTDVEQWLDQLPVRRLKGDDQAVAA